MNDPGLPDEVLKLRVLGVPFVAMGQKNDFGPVVQAILPHEGGKKAVGMFTTIFNHTHYYIISIEGIQSDGSVQFMIKEFF